MATKKEKPAAQTGIAGHLATIDLLIDEHRAVLYGLKLAGERVSDLEALFNLQTVYSEWTRSSVDSLAEKQKSLAEFMDSLYEGAKHHFRYEEEHLSPLLGEAVMQALVRTHERIRRQFRRAKSILAVRLDETNPDNLLCHKACIEEAVYDLCQMIDQHRTQEELLLQILKGMLEVSRNGRRHPVKSAPPNR